MAAPFVNVAVPSEAVPLKKVTVPPGAPPLDVTIAVSVSGAPIAIEAEARPRVVVVGIVVTVTEVAALVEAALLASPIYCADKLCAPGPLRTTDNVALIVAPDDAVPKTAEPIIVVPSKKFTVPVGNAFDCIPVSVAVNTVLDPDCTDEGEAASPVVVAVENGETVTVTLPNGYAAYVESPGYCAV